jgi:hypothetical protein
MRWRQHRYSAARAQPQPGCGDFSSVVLNMFKDIDVKDRVKPFAGRELSKNGALHFTGTRQNAGCSQVCQLPRHLLVWFQAKPSFLTAIAERTGNRTQPSADLNHVFADKGPDFTSPIAPPVSRSLEEVEFFAVVSIRIRPHLNFKNLETARMAFGCDFDWSRQGVKHAAPDPNVLFDRAPPLEGLIELGILSSAQTHWMVDHLP